MVTAASNVISATGRRKTAVARIQLVPGLGKIEINGRDFEDYFTTPAMKTLALLPLQTVDSLKKFDVKAKTHGGGLVGQAGALSLALARALIQVDPALRPTLKSRACFAVTRAKKNGRSRDNRAHASASSSPNAKDFLGSHHMGPEEERPQLQSVPTAVVGATGYSGQELLRYLARHPAFKPVVVTSRQNAGELLSKTVPGLPRAWGPLTFTDPTPEALAGQAELFFLGLPHGTAAPYVTTLRQAGKTVIDLSADFRTADPAVYKEFYDHDHPAPELLKEAVYGLPELHREQLKKTKLVAAPGCFPTSIILPLVPFLKAHMISPHGIHITSLSGVSGAGRKLELRLLFGEISDNMYPYGTPKHRHLGEIEQELSLAAGEKITVTFVPHLVPTHRGMLSTISASPARPLTSYPLTDADLLAVLKDAYAGEPFVDILEPPALPQSRNTAHSNRIEIAGRMDPRTGNILLFSSVDNLGKGNASQAIQAANLACGLDEKLGLE